MKLIPRCNLNIPWCIWRCVCSIKHIKMKRLGKYWLYSDLNVCFPTNLQLTLLITSFHLLLGRSLPNLPPTLNFHIYLAKNIFPFMLDDQSIAIFYSVHSLLWHSIAVYSYGIQNRYCNLKKLKNQLDHLAQQNCCLR